MGTNFEIKAYTLFSLHSYFKVQDGAIVQARLAGFWMGWGGALGGPLSRGS